MRRSRRAMAHRCAGGGTGFLVAARTTIPAARPLDTRSGTASAKGCFLPTAWGAGSSILGDGRTPPRWALSVQPASSGPDINGSAFDLLGPALAVVPAGEALDLGSLIGEDASEVGALLRHLAFSDLPLSDPEQLAHRLEAWRLEDEIAMLRSRLEGLEPGGQEYSHVFQELLGLEEKKRELRFEE